MQTKKQCETKDGCVERAVQNRFNVITLFIFILFTLIATIKFVGLNFHNTFYIFIYYQFVIYYYILNICFFSFGFILLLFLNGRKLCDFFILYFYFFTTF